MRTFISLVFFVVSSPRVAERESINKMSLHNLATVFGPTLLRPSEKDSKIPANPTQPITMTDSWSLEVMSQVKSSMCYCILCRQYLGSCSSLARPGGFEKHKHFQRCTDF